MKLSSSPLLFGICVLFMNGLTHAANTLDMNFSDGSVRLGYGHELSSTSQGRKEAGVGLLYNTDDNAMMDLWFIITDEAGSKAPGLDAGVGPKVYLGQTDTQEYLGLAIGGLLQYRPLKLNRLLLSAEGFIAPNIVTFLDADNVWEVGVRMGYEILPSAVAYISWREIRANFTTVEDEEVVDRGGQLGLKLRF